MSEPELNDIWGAEVVRLRDERDRLREALERIAKYGDNGICPYGCDTPHIAKAALTQGRGGANG